MHNGTTLVSKIRIIIRFPFPFIYVEQTCIHQFLYNMFIVHQIPYSPVHLCPDFKKHPSHLVMCICTGSWWLDTEYTFSICEPQSDCNGFTWRYMWPIQHFLAGKQWNNAVDKLILLAILGRISAVDINVYYRFKIDLQFLSIGNEVYAFVAHKYCTHFEYIFDATTKFA